MKYLIKQMMLIVLLSVSCAVVCMHGVFEGKNTTFFNKDATFCVTTKVRCREIHRTIIELEVKGKNGFEYDKHIFLETSGGAITTGFLSEKSLFFIYTSTKGRSKKTICIYDFYQDQMVFKRFFSHIKCCEGCSFVFGLHEKRPFLYDVEKEKCVIDEKTSIIDWKRDGRFVVFLVGDKHLQVKRKSIFACDFEKNKAFFLFRDGLDAMTIKGPYLHLIDRANQCEIVDLRTKKVIATHIKTFDAYRMTDENQDVEWTVAWYANFCVIVKKYDHKAQTESVVCKHEHVRHYCWSKKDGFFALNDGQDTLHMYRLFGETERDHRVFEDVDIMCLREGHLLVRYKSSSSDSCKHKIYDLRGNTPKEIGKKTLGIDEKSKIVKCGFFKRVSPFLFVIWMSEDGKKMVKIYDILDKGQALCAKSCIFTKENIVDICSVEQMAKIFLPGGAVVLFSLLTKQIIGTLRSNHNCGVCNSGHFLLLSKDFHPFFCLQQKEQINQNSEPSAHQLISPLVKGSDLPRGQANQMTPSGGECMIGVKRKRESGPLGQARFVSHLSSDDIEMSQRDGKRRKTSI